MNTRKKGNIVQNEIRKYLEVQGYIVHNFPCAFRPLFLKGKMVYTRHSNDVFGVDMICRRLVSTFCPETGASVASGEVLWIQATADSSVTKRLDEFRKWWAFALPGERVQLWQKRKGGEIVIRDYSPERADMVITGRIIKGVYYDARYYDARKSKEEERG